MSLSNQEMNNDKSPGKLQGEHLPVPAESARQPWWGPCHCGRAHGGGYHCQWETPTQTAAAASCSASWQHQGPPVTIATQALTHLAGYDKSTSKKTKKEGKQST